MPRARAVARSSRAEVEVGLRRRGGLRDRERVLAVAERVEQRAELANNHAYDQYPSGATRTREAVLAARILGVGVGPTVDASRAPGIIERGGLRVTFLAFTQFVNGRPQHHPEETEVARWDEPSMLAAVTRARATADVVVVSMHWSHDFVTDPTPRQRRAAAHLVEAGADVILGHGPHVLQTVERMRSSYGDAICAYSLGNLLSNQGGRYVAGRERPGSVHPAIWMPMLRDGVWMRLTLTRGAGGLVISPVEAILGELRAIVVEGSRPSPRRSSSNLNALRLPARFQRR